MSCSNGLGIYTEKFRIWCGTLSGTINSYTGSLQTSVFWRNKLQVCKNVGVNMLYSRNEIVLTSKWRTSDNKKLRGINTLFIIILLRNYEHGFGYCIFSDLYLTDYSRHLKLTVLLLCIIGCHYTGLPLQFNQHANHVFNRYRFPSKSSCLILR